VIVNVFDQTVFCQFTKQKCPKSYAANLTLAAKSCHVLENMILLTHHN